MVVMSAKILRLCAPSGQVPPRRTRSFFLNVCLPVCAWECSGIVWRLASELYPLASLRVCAPALPGEMVSWRNLGWSQWQAASPLIECLWPFDRSRGEGGERSRSGSL